MLPEEKTVGKPWAFFLVRKDMDRYTLLVDHEIDAPGN
jgi:hypothetical protein